MLLTAGVVGPIWFIVIFLIEGATRPGYSVWRNYVSDLALSNQGWEQIANFVLCGALFIAFALGLKRVWQSGRGSTAAPALIGLAGLELVVAGVFGIDPGRGYPPGAPLTSEPHTIHAYIHGLNGLIIFNLVLPAACFVVAKRFVAVDGNRKWMLYSLVTGVLLIILSVTSTAASPLVEKRGIAFPIGVVQRAQIILGWVWVSLLSWRELKRNHPVDPAAGPPKAGPLRGLL